MKDKGFISDISLGIAMFIAFAASATLIVLATAGTWIMKGWKFLWRQSV